MRGTHDPTTTSLRRSAALVAALLLVLATAPAVAADEHGTDRPIDIRLSETIYWTFEPISGCPVQTVMEGTGIATHLGRTTMHASHCPPLAPGDDYHDARMTLTAANGDTLTLTYDADPAGTGAATITGGTGRFDGATGELNGSVVFTWAPWENGMPVPPWYAEGHFWGTVTY